jgi:GTP-binding protein
VVVLTKRDLLAPDAPLSLINAPQASGQVVISSVAGTGLEDLKEFLWRFVEVARSEATAMEEPAQVLSDDESEPD